MTYNQLYLVHYRFRVEGYYEGEYVTSASLRNFFVVFSWENTASELRYIL